MLRDEAIWRSARRDKQLACVYNASPQSYPQASGIRARSFWIKHLPILFHALVRKTETRRGRLAGRRWGGPGVRVAVVVETPQHSGLTSPLDYLAPQALPPGTLVRVPLGRRVVLGVVWDEIAVPDGSVSALRDDQLKPITEVLDGLPPCLRHGDRWCRLQPATTSARWAKWP